MLADPPRFTFEDLLSKPQAVTLFVGRWLSPLRSSIECFSVIVMVLGASLQILSLFPNTRSFDGYALRLVAITFPVCFAVTFVVYAYAFRCFFSAHVDPKANFSAQEAARKLSRDYRAWLKSALPPSMMWLQ